MRRRLLLTMVGLTVVAVLVVGVPTVVVADPDTQALVLGLGAVVIVASIAAALVLSAGCPARSGSGPRRPPGCGPVPPGPSAAATAWPSWTRWPTAWTAPAAG